MRLQPAGYGLVEIGAEAPLRPSSWVLRRRQLAAILRIELEKSLLSRRAVLAYLLALLPVAILAALALVHGRNIEIITDASGHVTRHVTSIGMLDDPQRAREVFAAIFYELILRTVVFFGCAWIFMNLFRGELIDRSLHYYLLVPVRREVLLVGKYLSGLLTALILFVSSTLACLFFLYYPRGYEGAIDALAGSGGREALAYLGIVVLACIGYGAIFVLVGLFFRNPVMPALVFYVWEYAQFLFPPLLQKLSVVHYLRSLLPVPLPLGQLAVVVEPTSAWISVPGLLLFTALVLVLAAARVRKMEITYAGEE